MCLTSKINSCSRTITFIILIGIIFVLGSFRVQSQTIKTPITWQANRYGQEHGLLQLNVKGMALDSLGFLWVGTEDGLHRFNGYEFTPFIHNPNDSTSIKDDHIRGLHFAKNTLWIATSSQGVCAYIPTKNIFYNPFLNSKSSDINISFKVLQHNNNTLIFSIQNQLIYFNVVDGKSMLYNLPNYGKVGHATAIQHLSNGECFIATTASGLLKMNTETMKLSEKSYLQNHLINALHQEKNKVLIGTESGMYVYHNKEDTVYATSLKNPTNCFYKKSDDLVLIGTDNGLFQFDLTKNEITPVILDAGEKRIYQSVDINQIIGDKRGNIWIGTEGDGLLYYNSYQIKFRTVNIELSEYPLTTDISTFQILELADKSLLLGSKHGIVRYNNQLNRFKLFPSTKDILIYTLKQDKNGNIWAGGFTSGLLKYNRDKDDFRQIRPSGTLFSDDDIIEIVAVNEEVLWICTWSGGIYSYNIKSNTSAQLLLNNKKINRARISFIDSKNNIWLGTDEGVYRISEQLEVEHFSSETTPKLSSNRVFSINEDSSGHIWVGTNVGLTKLNLEQKDSELFYKQKGFPNDFIYSILIDDNDKIWASTNYGISVYDPQNSSFKNYTTSDGLQNNEFNGKAGYIGNSGHFYFGGISGINIFKPDKVAENPHLPKVMIESVELFNQKLQQNELYKNHLQFKSKENVLSFNFAALNFLNPEKCNYQYKMEGFDTDWRPVTKQRSTTYTNLDSGDYTFKVKATNDAGIWNQIPATIKVTIVPPWYETNLFRIPAIVLFLLSGILYYAYQTRKLKHDKVKLERIVSERTQQVREKNKQLESAFLEAQKQSRNIGFLMKELRHRVKNNLQIISSLLNIQSNMVESQSARQALKTAKNRIVAISHIENKITSAHEHIEIGAFLEELSETIVQVLSGEQNLKYKLNFNLSIIEVQKINTTLIGLILNELITNATKYAFDSFSAKNTLEIGCSNINQTLVVWVNDNGKGYNREKTKTNSLGLELVQDMVNQLGARLTIENEKGTKNKIEIPLQK